MSSRVIIIGDVHGCHEELDDLLDKLRLKKRDSIIFLGDLVNRGPSSTKVLARARELKAICLRGNHERRLLLAKRSGKFDGLKEHDIATYKTLKKADWHTLETTRSWYHLPDFNTVCVHGGFLPAKPWKEQPEEVVTEIQVVEDGKPLRRSQSPASPHWSDLWEGPPYVIYGHTPLIEVRHSRFALGLDTGCVYGNRLSACILPGRKVIQTPARAQYWNKSL